MNSKVVNFIEKFSYALSSNLIALAISGLVILIIPRLIGVEEYGYWQLYLFYSSYVGFLHFGWIDGIYLKYGGKEYNELNKGLFFSQFCMLSVFQISLAAILFFYSDIFIYDTKMTFVFKMISFCLVITNTRFMLLYILQCTNRIKEYARVTMLDRILYCLLIIIFLLVGIREYEIMIAADLIGRFISLIYAMCYCQDIVFRRISTFYLSLEEALQNINIGIKLMFANIASMLLIGVVRFGIERSWDVTTFGKVSLTLSVSNLMLIFINAIGIIMFPLLRRTDEKNLPSIYLTMRDILVVVMLSALIIYYPLKTALSAWLPQYADSLRYMAMILPMCVFEGKMSLLINTYLKTLRKEALMLKINLVSLTLSIIFTFISTVLIRSLDLAILLIVLILAFRCSLAEIFLSRILKITLYRDIALELMMIFIFVLTGWFINSWLVVIIYLIACIFYLVVKRQDIAYTTKKIKLLLVKS